MKLVPGDERYDDWAAHFQLVQADVLNRVLKENGIGDPAVRREIVGSYVFETGDILDQCWFRVGGAKVYPVMCFSDSSQYEAEERGDERTLFASEEGFDFHEYAYGTVGEYFENGEKSDVEVGLVGEDDAGVGDEEE